MALSNNPHNYSHIPPILDSALAKGGGRYTLSSKKAAMRWRQEAYHYRTLMQKLAQEAILAPGVLAATPYDNMFLTLDGATVIIQLRDRAMEKGQLTDLEGVPIHTVQPAVPTDLANMAEKLKKELLG